MVIVDMTNATKKILSQYSGYMYFQVWSNKVNTANFCIIGVSNKLDDRTNQENYNNCIEIINHCKLNNIPCDGIMVHNSNGCYFHKNN